MALPETFPFFVVSAAINVEGTVAFIATRGQERRPDTHRSAVAWPLLLKSGNSSAPFGTGVSDFVQERHKSPSPLDRPRELVVACPPMQSHVNLSRIARAAGCCGVERMICCGNAKLIGKIARDAVESLRVEVHRTLPPVLAKLRQQGFEIVGLEQTTGAASLFEFPFQRQTLWSWATSGRASKRRCCGWSAGPWKSPSTACPWHTTRQPPPR